MNLGYDLHVVRTPDWLDAAKTPILLEELDAVIQSDPELQWSKTDYVDMADIEGNTVRYWMIEWRGSSCFWWYRDQIRYKSANDYVQATKKLLQIADKLKARVVGDDGEAYSIVRLLFRGERLIATDCEGKERKVK